MAPNGTAGTWSSVAGGPTSFGPARSTTTPGDETAKQPDGPEVVPPRGSRRWWPDEDIKAPSERVRREVHSLICRKPLANSFSDWQMSLPFDLPSGSRNPVCALGECGDPSCPAYRPKHPEVREAVEKTILDKCLAHFKGGTEFRTYASVGCGLLAQDWIVLERLRENGMRPQRAIFVDTNTARPVIMCEGGTFPRPSVNGGMNLRQTGFCGTLGPEFSFAATIQFGEQTRPSVLFDFCNGPGDDAIYVEVGGPEDTGLLVFGVSCGTECKSLQIRDCWKPSFEGHTFLFTVSAMGVLRVFKDRAPIAAGFAQKARTVVRRHLYVGQSGDPDTSFTGCISQIRVWDHEVDKAASELLFETEVESALKQLTQWYCGHISVWSFGSLASYAAATEKDPRFAADLLVRVDVHEDLDGYDDFCCQALSKHGMSLTLGGPGKSWMRSGGGWCPVDASCAVLDDAEKRALTPWASSPGYGSDHCSLTGGDALVASAWCRSRRLPNRRRPRPHCRRSRTDKVTNCVGKQGKAPADEEGQDGEEGPELDRMEELFRKAMAERKASADRPVPSRTPVVHGPGERAPGPGARAPGLDVRAPGPDVRACRRGTSRVHFKQEVEEKQPDALSSEPTEVDDDEQCPPLVELGEEPPERVAERPLPAERPRGYQFPRGLVPKRTDRCLPQRRGCCLNPPCAPNRGVQQRTSRPAPKDALGGEDEGLPSIEELLADLDDVSDDAGAP